MESTTRVSSNSTVYVMQNDTDLIVEIWQSLDFWLFVFALVVTAPANILIMYLLSQQRKTTSTCGFTTFAISLAFTDILVGVIILPLQLVQLTTDHWPLGSMACLLYQVLDCGFASVSCFLVATMGYDRYKCVTSPIAYRTNFQQRRIVVTTVVIWVFGIGTWAAGLTIAHLRREGGSVYINCAVEGSAYLTISVAIVMFNLPLGITVLTYLLLVLKLRKRLNSKPTKSHRKCGSDAKPQISQTRYQVSRVIQGNSETPSEQEHCDKTARDVPSVFNECATVIVHSSRSNQNQRCLRTSLLIVLSLVLCWGPVCLTWPIVQLCEDCIDMDKFKVIAFFSYANSTINPFIYFATSVKLRQDFRKLFLRE